MYAPTTTPTLTLDSKRSNDIRSTSQYTWRSCPTLQISIACPGHRIGTVSIRNKLRLLRSAGRTIDVRQATHQLSAYTHGARNVEADCYPLVIFSGTSWVLSSIDRESDPLQRRPILYETIAPCYAVFPTRQPWTWAKQGARRPCSCGRTNRTW